MCRLWQQISNIIVIILTSDRSNLITGRIAATHGRFSGIRLVAPVCTPPNTILGPTRVQIPNGISIGSAVFAQLTAEIAIVHNGPPLSPLKLPPSHVGIWTPI